MQRIAKKLLQTSRRAVKLISTYQTPTQDGKNFTTMKTLINSLQIAKRTPVCAMACACAQMQHSYQPSLPLNNVSPLVSNGFNSGFKHNR